MSDPLLRVNGLSHHYPGPRGLSRRGATVRAVDDVSLQVDAGELVGLVGESGSGKTTLGQAILRMHTPTSGTVLFAGHDVLSLPRAELQALRPAMQYVFQDPFSALNPRITVREAIAEPLLHHRLATRDTVTEQVVQSLVQCQLGPEALDRYPHEFSGGQRQRIVIARAMALKPKFVVADEPVSALDVSIQAQIINLFSDLSSEQGTAFLFISHDLSVVEHLCSRILIMFRGRIVESGSRDQIFGSPRHPYTRELLAAVPVPDPRRRVRVSSRIDRPWDQPEGLSRELQAVGDGHWAIPTS